MGFPVVHFEFNAQNAANLQKFYAAVFGWKINTDNPMGYGLVDTDAKSADGGPGINGGIGGAMPGAPPVTIYVQVPKLGPVLENIKKNGGMVLMEPMAIPGANIALAMFQDPEKNIIGLYKPGEAE